MRKDRPSADALVRALEAPFRLKPRFVAIRQTQLGIAAHDAVHGWRARPLSRKRRASWVRLVVWFVRSRAATYTEVLTAARALGDHLRANGYELDPLDERHDSLARCALRDRLVEIARRKPWRDPDEYREELADARIVQFFQQMQLDRVCVGCGGSLPCAACGRPAFRSGNQDR